MRDFHQQRLTRIDHRIVEKTNQNLLIDFVHAYMTCALFTEMDNSDPDTGGEPLDANHTLKDFSVDTYRRMAIDCAVFIQKATPILTGLDMHEIIPAADGHSYTRWEMVAHDFWMTRQGHGTGFWDRPSYVYPPQVGKRLTALAKDFQPMTLEVSGNGKTINHL